MRRIAFINEKGGTCKTTLAVNVAAYLATQKRQRVLVLDLDTQGHAGKALGLDARGIVPNVFHLLCDDEVSPQQCIHPTAIEGLSVIPSYKQMSEFPVAVAAAPDRFSRLARRVEQLGGFDVVIFDAPPSMGLTTVNILVAASEVVVPVGLTYFALDGCAEVAETVRKVAADHARPDLRVSLVVPTLYRRTALAEAILEKLRGYFPDQLASTPLGFNVKIDEAQSHGQTIFEYAPRSSGAKMLAAIADEIWVRGAQVARAA